jgi:dUTP pyrophosphatase
MTTLKFKKLHENAVLPTYAKPGDAGLDLTATTVEHTDAFIQYGTGIAVEIPEGHVGLIFPRSSVTKQDLMLKNSVGVIDSGYRGEISFRFKSIKPHKRQYKPGDKIGQLIVVPIPTMEPVFVDELSDTERGDGSYGSTGR